MRNPLFAVVAVLGIATAALAQSDTWVIDRSSVRAPSGTWDELPDGGVKVMARFEADFMDGGAVTLMHPYQSCDCAALNLACKVCLRTKVRQANRFGP